MFTVSKYEVNTRYAEFVIFLICWFNFISKLKYIRRTINRTMGLNLYLAGHHSLLNIFADCNSYNEQIVDVDTDEI